MVMATGACRALWETRRSTWRDLIYLAGHVGSSEFVGKFPRNILKLALSAAITPNLY
jgi:hypothetical protein